MHLICKTLIFSLLTAFWLPVYAQRTYNANSVLSSGNWYKLSVGEPGIYKIDLSFLNSLGISGIVPSGQIRIFGNSGSMLAEANDQQRLDDLVEISIEVNDGGDGVLNGSDYILFYSRGPDIWDKDSVNERFIH